MKKTIFGMAMIFSMALCSCGNSCGTECADVDSTAVDTCVVDTCAADTLAADTVADVL